MTTTSPSPKVLVVDDEPHIQELLSLAFHRMGVACDTAGSVHQAHQLLAARSYHLCLADMGLPDGTGLELVRHIAEHHAPLPVVVVTAHGSMENAIAALKAGAFDYINKPVGVETLRTMVSSILAMNRNADAAPEIPLLGRSTAMDQVRNLIRLLARNQAPVHIHGESGTGKELAARQIHELGPRKGKPFLAVNCGAIPEMLLESEFFGYRKGAFTGANADREGFFQAAKGGTLFLDEVADLPLMMQVKLLRVLQERKVRRVGDVAEEAVDVRLISATHQNLHDMVESKKFRQDLYFRLNVVELVMPPLREHREDVPLLVEHYLDRLHREQGMTAVVAPDALDALMHHDFPGNVRELENMLIRALALCTDGKVGPADLLRSRMTIKTPVPETARVPKSAPRQEAPALPKKTSATPPTASLLTEEVVATMPDEAGADTPEAGADAQEAGADAQEAGADTQGAGADTLQSHLDQYERSRILEALRENNNNRAETAKALGLTLRSLRYRMLRLNIKVGESSGE